MIRRLYITYSLFFFHFSELRSIFRSDVYNIILIILYFHINLIDSVGGGAARGKVRLRGGRLVRGPRRGHAAPQPRPHDAERGAEEQAGGGTPGLQAQAAGLPGRADQARPARPETTGQGEPSR